MASTAKIAVTEKPVRVGKAWKVNIDGHGVDFIPDTFFWGYNPGTKKADIDTFILIEKKIPFKV